MVWVMLALNIEMMQIPVSTNVTATTGMPGKAPDTPLILTKITELL